MYARRPTAPFAAAVALSSAAVAAHADDGARQRRAVWQPSTALVQLGAADGAHAVVVGATWEWSWRRSYRYGVVSGYWEASIGRWVAEAAPRARAWVTQLGVTPTLRLSPHGADRWFIEAGIGANVLTPVYRNGDKRFSTAFNFGDHLAVGWRFGAGRQHEIAVRIQHFSNAGIRHPNPGENFVQLRYSVDV